MKPYDKAAAQAELAKLARDLRDYSDREMDVKYREVTNRLELYATTVAALPEGFSALFEKASHVVIDNFPDFPGRPGVGDGEGRLKIDSYGIFIHGVGEARRSIRGGTAYTSDPVEIPNKPHRVLIFFIPVEEKKP